jgi:hypothetical protein
MVSALGIPNFGGVEAGSAVASHPCSTSLAVEPAIPLSEPCVFPFQQAVRQHEGGSSGCQKQKHLESPTYTGTFKGGRGLVAREQVGRRAPAGLVFEIDVPQRLPVLVLDDEAGLRLISRPGRREAARRCAQCSKLNVLP